MIKWEYKIILLYDELSMEDKLNELGKERWELVQLLNTGFGVFKRNADEYIQSKLKWFRDKTGKTTFGNPDNDN